MRTTEGVNCKVCGRVFCCAECRQRHEEKTHAIAVHGHTTSLSDSSGEGSTSSNTDSANSLTIYLFCPICEKRPLALQEEMHSEMVKHIANTHLPLHCKKCAKVYSKIDDLLEFSKCQLPMVTCTATMNCSAFDRNHNDMAPMVVTNDKVAPEVHCSTISTQTSPMGRRLSDFNDSTPISIINLRWKAKSKLSHEEFIGDSVSSIRNLSSISNSSLRRSIDVQPCGVKGKVVRSTSTPVHTEVMHAKPKEQTFNATGGQVSSIYGSGCESDHSPAVPVNRGSGSTASSKQPPENGNRYLRVGGGRTKMPAVTPLRHVMSKSIQKAFAEHGVLPSARETIYNQMGKSHSIDVSAGPPSSESSIPGSPLDLRLSPALRRSQSDISHYGSRRNCAQSAMNGIGGPIRREILLSSQKVTTESIVITRTQHLVCAKATNGDSEPLITNSICNSSADSSDNSSASTSAGSVYNTCRSIKIITASSELSEVNIAATEVGDKLCALPPPIQVHQHGRVAGVCNLAPITPITRIPGASINKKLIKFDPPNVYAEMEQSQIGTSTHCSPGDVFFTPNATLNRKPSVRITSMQNEPSESGSGSGFVRKCIVPRKLSNGFTPTRRPCMRECAAHYAFNRVEDIDIDDEVFLPQEASTKNDTQPPKSNAWLLSSIVNSVMRLPSSLVGMAQRHSKGDSTESKENIHTHSLLKRCASMAGSLVRSKSLVDDGQLQSLKRKRTNTLDSGRIPNSSWSPKTAESSTTLASSDSTAFKRIRIQGRKPIDRMRLDAESFS